MHALQALRVRRILIVEAAEIDSLERLTSHTNTAARGWHAMVTQRTKLARVAAHNLLVLLSARGS